MGDFRAVPIKNRLLRYLLGEEIVEVGSFVEETSAKDFANVDDNAVCILKQKRNYWDTSCSWTYCSKEDNSTIIYGEKKAILRLEDDPIHPLIVQYATGGSKI